MIKVYMNAHRPKENKECNRFLCDFPRTSFLIWISNDVPNILSPVLTVPVWPRFAPVKDSRYTVMNRDTFPK